MLSLHKVTDITKTILKWVVIVGGSIFVLILFIRFSLFVKELIFPTPPPPPTVSFGKLPAIPFGENVTHEQLNFTLNTLTGTLPALPDRATVYKTSSPRASLLDLERARERIKVIGFQGKETRISDNVFEWKTTSENLQRSILLNIVTYDFKYTTSYLTDPSSQLALHLPNEAQAVEIASDFLESLALLTDDIDPEQTKTLLLTIKDDFLVPASSLSTAHVVRVDFYQKAINEFPIYYPNPPASLISVLIASGTRGPIIAEVNYLHQQLSTENATYPIKSTQSAFAELQQGKGYIAAFNGSTTTVQITDVSLGYYFGNQKLPYSMPVIVFKGENDFYAYIPALTDEFTSY